MKAIGIILAGGNNTDSKTSSTGPAGSRQLQGYRFFTQQHVKLTYTDSCDIDTI